MLPELKTEGNLTSSANVTGEQQRDEDSFIDSLLVYYYDYVYDNCLRCGHIRLG